MPVFVVVFHLPEDSEALRNGPVVDLLKQRCPDRRIGTASLRRVVITCPVDDVFREVDVIQKVCKARSVQKVVLLLEGPPQHEGVSGRQLELPRDASSGLAVIWVADARGVVWDLKSSQATGTTVFDDDPDGRGSYAVLLDVLRLPKVFNAVYERGAGRGPLSPALRVLVPGIPDSRLLRSAEITALRELTAPGDAGVGREDGDALLGFSKITQDPSAFFTADGDIGKARREAERARTLATKELRRLETRPSRPQRIKAQNAVAAFAAQLDQLRVLLRQLLEDVNADTGNIRGAGGLVRRAGVPKSIVDRLGERDGDGSPDDERVRLHVLGRIHDVRSVPVVTAELRATALKERPRTADGALERLGKEHAEKAILTLKSPPPVLLQAEPLSLWLLGTAAAAATCWPSFLRPVAGLALVAVAGWLGWLTADGRRLWRKATPKEPSESSGFFRRVCVLVGGVGLGAGATVASGAPLALQLASLVIAPVALTGYIWRTWRHSVQTWADAWDIRALTGYTRDQGAPSSATVDERLLIAARDVIGTDWLRTESRLAFADKITRVADALEALRARLVVAEAQRCAEQRAATSGALPRACNPAVCVDLEAEGISALYRSANHHIDDIVRNDYFDAFVHVVVEEWAVLTASYSDGSVDAVVAGLDRWLTQYSEALHDDGIYGGAQGLSEMTSALLSEAGLQQREDQLKSVWEDLPLDELLDDKDDLVQFCADEDLGMLDQDEAYEIIRFAPPVVMSNHKYTLSSMLMAGILRLVPLRTTALAHPIEDESLAA